MVIACNGIYKLNLLVKYKNLMKKTPFRAFFAPSLAIRGQLEPTIGFRRLTVAIPKRSCRVTAKFLGISVNIAGQANSAKRDYLLAGFFSIFAQLSRRVTDRLKTNLLDEES